MTYSTVADIRREFKSVLEAGTVITDDKIIEFQLQNYSLINSYVGTRFSVPVTGAAPVNQQDKISFSTAGGAGEVKSVTITASGKSKSYSYTTIGADTPSQQATGILASINSDKDRVVEPSLDGADLVLESRVLGFSYALAVSGAGVSFLNTVVADLGSTALRLLRMIETELTACKIAGILKTKVADKLQNSGVRQDIKDETCGKSALALLRDIQNGKASLDAEIIASTSGTGGLESSSYAGTYQVGVRQW
jgi:hypothetical protein